MMGKLSEVSIDINKDLKKEFSELEKRGSDNLVVDWLDDGAASEYLSLEYNDDVYGKLCFDWTWTANSEGFYVNDEEFFDHIAVHNDGSIVVALIETNAWIEDNKKVFKWYRLNL